MTSQGMSQFHLVKGKTMSENQQVPDLIRPSDITVDEKELELKRSFLESLRLEVEVETEINRLKLRRTLAQKEELILEAITPEKLEKESSKSLSEAFISFVKAGQLLGGEPTEISKHEFSGLSDAELDQEEARIARLLIEYREQNVEIRPLSESVSDIEALPEAM